MKINGRGKASILTPEDFAKLSKNCQRDDRRLLLYILRYSGERVGAVCQLKVKDVYANPQEKEPNQWITFRANTRKASPTGEQQGHQVPVHENLRSQLMAFSPPESDWLFPSPKNEGSINPKTIDTWFRNLMARSGVGHKGYSLHSFRRTFITELNKKGVGLPSIQSLTGHKSVRSVQQYVDVTDEVKVGAIALIA